ncbi:hypothetical protein [Neisseria bergeri]|uniref:hypothetical protein n=1 Tax=Neisseria bergeri TaxID=1906581 RepID=UPI000E5954D5|nr:hypothetical protein [Neisseria bergeri]
MPSETSFDRFRRHFHTPPPPFQTAFLYRIQIYIKYKNTVIPAPSPPVQTGTKTFPRHSRESGNPERKI